MKTFNQFITEAGAAPSHRPTIDRFFAAGGASNSKQSQRQKKRYDESKAKAEEGRKARGLPQGTSAEASRAHIAAQLASLKATPKQKPELQSAPIKPRQLEIKYMRPDKPNIPLSLDAKLIPKLSKLPKAQKARSTKTPKPKQLRIPRT